ncbi:hypothetical protein BC941DRAFT_500569 [Chlamydoabsidia padenii]|nr:hypothetical protein BC941DRAFT_500569 [Chlamydoabsidia padenii]
MDVVYVIHQFEAENEDEISLCIGDPVIVLEKDDGFEDGWWRGRNKDGQQGLFPVNYTSVDRPSSADDEDDGKTCSDISEDDDRLSSSSHSQISSLSHPLSTPSISTATHRLGYSSYSLATSSTSRNDDQCSSLSTPPLLSPNITFASRNLQKAVRAALLSTSLSPVPPEQWETEHVADWLTQLGFESVVDQFIEQEITGDVLLELSLQSLKELEIDTYGKRFKIHSAILALREEIFRQDPFYLHPTKSCLNTTEYQSPPHSPMDNLSTQPEQHILYRNPSIDIQDDQVAPDMEGWLYKQGDRYKTWNKRWFVLKGSNLFYFKSPKDVRMKGLINLRGYRMVCDETICVGQYSFKAQHERERTFYFYADTDLSMKAWIQSLIKATIARDYNSPVPDA